MIPSMGYGVGLFFRVSAPTVFWGGAKWGFLKKNLYFDHFSSDFDGVCLNEFLAKNLIEWTPPVCLYLLWFLSYKGDKNDHAPNFEIFHFSSDFDGVFF